MGFSRRGSSWRYEVQTGRSGRDIGSRRVCLAFSRWEISQKVGIFGQALGLTEIRSKHYARETA